MLLVPRMKVNGYEQYLFIYLQLNFSISAYQAKNSFLK